MTFTSIKGCVFVPLLCLSQCFHIGCTLKKTMQDESIGFPPPIKLIMNQFALNEIQIVFGKNGLVIIDNWQGFCCTWYFKKMHLVIIIIVANWMQNYFYPHFYIESIFTPSKGQCNFSKKYLSCIVPKLYACVFLSFLKEAKTLITTLKFNPSFSIMVKRILLQAHLPLRTCFMYRLILFAWLKLILHMNSLCFVTFFFFFFFGFVGYFQRMV